ncbi:hypothetical protein DFH29DRAFT_995586 [Suillus ampliporus]|nr:hypothetical protein DFH29DRAFT_995586 [Suillus ampliporus]
MVNINHLDHEGDIVLDAVLQLLSSLTLSQDDAQNLTQVIIDSTTNSEPHFPLIVQTPTIPIVQTPAVPIVQTLAIPIMQTLAVPIVQTLAVPIMQTPAVPIVQTQSPTPPTVQTQPVITQPPPTAQITQPPPTTLPTQSLHDLPTTRVIVNGEEGIQQHYEGFAFDIPHANTEGPFYLVTRGRRVGVFSTWPHTSPHVIGVSCSSFSRAQSVTDGILHILDAVDLGEAWWLP